jgi:hypothetical protein
MFGTGASNDRCRYSVELEWVQWEALVMAVDSDFLLHGALGWVDLYAVF